MNVKDQEIPEIMKSYKKVTVIGLSPDSEKPSFYVPEFMQTKGWDIVGVYPKTHKEGGFTIYTSLSEVPKEHRRFIQIFRASDKIPSIVDEVLALGGTEVLWLQLGIQHPEAEARAQRAGLKVISNRCMKPEYQKWFGS